MYRSGVFLVCVLAVGVTVNADHWFKSFWGRFKYPWTIFQRPSYNIRMSVNLTDANNDGIITLEEISNDAPRFDANNDGRLTRCEFVRYNVDTFGARPEIVASNFDFIDRTRDNFIWRDDAALLDMTGLDINKDSRVTTDEVRQLLRQADFDAQKKAECEPYHLYRLPSAELRKMKKKCAWRKQN